MSKTWRKIPFGKRLWLIQAGCDSFGGCPLCDRRTGIGTSLAPGIWRVGRNEARRLKKSIIAAGHTKIKRNLARLLRRKAKRVIYYAIHNQNLD